MTVNVGIIGCGSITRYRHAPEYFANPGCKIVAFSDPVAERSEEMSVKFGGRVCEDYGQIINDPDIDAVSVCTSNATHAQISIEALNAGKHVLCEKPMAVNSDQAKSMIEAAKRNNKILMPGHNQRLFPAHIKGKAIIKSGELGKVLSFRSCFKHKGPETWSADKNGHTWFFDKRLSSVGVLGDLGVHKIDLMRWLLDEKIESVYAQVATLDKRYPNGELIQVEDNAIILGKTTSGKIGTIEVSWTNYGKEDNGATIYCEKGVLKIYTDPQADIVIEMRDGSIIKYSFTEISTNEQQKSSGIIDNFIDAIINNKQPIVTGEDGYESIAIIEACVRASDRELWEKVSY